MSEPIGDAACWLHQVCEICGAVISGTEGHRPGCERELAVQELDVSSAGPRLGASREVRAWLGCKKPRRDSHG